MSATRRPDPKWAPRRWILQQFGLPVRAFESAVTNGFVRSAKFGERNQSARVFNVADAAAYLEAISEGRKPRVVRKLKPTGNNLRSMEKHP